MPYAVFGLAVAAARGLREGLRRFNEARPGVPPLESGGTPDGS